MERIPRQGVVLRRALIAFALMICAAAAPASAATFTVDTTADTAGAGCAGAPGGCSIRKAINASSDGDTVAIPAGHYLLDPALKAIYVDRDITFKGTGN